MEHTPKNILIRAVKKQEKKIGGGYGCRETGVKEMTEFLHVNTCLQKLFEEEGKQEHS